MPAPAHSPGELARHFSRAVHLAPHLRTIRFESLQLAVRIYVQQVQEHLKHDYELTIAHELRDVTSDMSFASQRLLPAMFAYLIAAVETYRPGWEIPRPTEHA